MRQISSLELKVITEKLRQKILQGKINKVKGVKDSVIFEIQKEEKFSLVIVPGKSIFLTTTKYQSEGVSGFFELLRKNLVGEKIEDINQHEFDRIIYIETSNYILFAEFFGNGNLILTKKPEKTIIKAIEMRSWSSREIKPGLTYKYPPSNINPFKVKINDLKKLIKEKEIVKILAKAFGFGGEFAEKICERFGVDKNSRDEKDLERIVSGIEKIENLFPEFENINQMIEKDFEIHLKEDKSLEETAKKIEGIKEAQKRKLEELVKLENTYRIYAESIYDNYPIFDNKLTRLRELQLQKISKEEIEKRIGVEFLPEGTKVLIKNVPIDYKKTLEENADEYYKLAKKMRVKMEGLEKAMNELGLNSPKKSIKMESVPKRKEWFENFRWFISSDGLLVVSGRDARTNEKLIRKHMKEGDLVFHTDITGSPFTLVKGGKNLIPEETIKEAAEFCGAYSKAWKIGISFVDVYYVKPEQVKKEGGLPQGSFMIYGKREWIRQIPVKISIGLKDGEIVSGPPSMVKNFCKNYIEIKPGDKDAKALHELIKKKIPIGLEELQKILPYGKGDLV
ncbi:MAG: NFACT family protein [Candidatus Aenigmatarchaeota archaeon]